MSDLDTKSDSAAPETTPEAAPLPIWFFVGLILAVYGVLVIVAGLVYPTGTTVLANTRPALWWGAVMVVAGALFLFIGLRKPKQIAQKGK